MGVLCQVMTSSFERIRRESAQCQDPTHGESLSRIESKVDSIQKLLESRADDVEERAKLKRDIAQLEKTLSKTNKILESVVERLETQSQELKSLGVSGVPVIHSLRPVFPKQSTLTDRISPVASDSSIPSQDLD